MRKDRKFEAVYCIPRPTHETFLSTDPVVQLREMFDEKKIITNAKLIVGCNIISFENRFTGILDLAYKSFLLSMYYSTVSLASLATERICYDLIEYSEIQFGGQILESKQKKSLYRIPYSDILNLLYGINIINERIKKNLFKINMIRNKYNSSYIRWRTNGRRQKYT